MSSINAELTQDEKSLNLDAIVQYKIKLRTQTDYWKQKLKEGVHFDEHTMFKLECFERDWEILDSLEQKLEKEYGMSKY